MHFKLELPQATWLLAAALMAACGGHAAADPADAAMVAAGRQTVAERGCITCHGEALSGSTVAYPGTQAFPPNLTPDHDTGLGTWSDEQIARAVLDGMVGDRQLCNAMPTYGEQGMTEEQAQEVVAYLRSLPAVARKIPKTVSCTAPGK